MSNFTMRNFINILKELDHSSRKDISKLQAKYIDNSDSNDQCRVCQHYKSPNQCEIVNGQINPNGWCKYFERT